MTHNPLDWPHPHLDPRQPRNGTTCGTNPPVFIGPYQSEAKAYRLRIARTADLRKPILDKILTPDPIFLPEQALPAGTWYWNWSTKNGDTPTYSFTIPDTAIILPVPPAAEWLCRLGGHHPRIFVANDDLAALRASRFSARRGLWQRLQHDAEKILRKKHFLKEPPFLPGANNDRAGYDKAFFKIMRDTRQFSLGANTLALAYLASGDRRYARAACERIVCLSRWDPEGSTSLANNDEAHMSLLWHGSQTVDWIWDTFSAGELKLVISQFRRRGEITYEHMHNRGCYGINRFDSHAGREIVFLAQLAFVFHEHIPQAAQWLDWLRPVLCGRWPVWAEDDGAWAEGILYCEAYTGIMSIFCETLNRIGINLYQRPFWRGNLLWRERVLPPWARWIGPGDGSEPHRALWRMAADQVTLIANRLGAAEYEPYAGSLRKWGEVHGPGVEDMSYFREVAPLEYLAKQSSGKSPGTKRKIRNKKNASVLSAFTDGGWAVFGTDQKPNGTDGLRMIFRSSPFGNDSHQAAAQNDFVLHAGGMPLLMPSGFYDGYATPHHAAWVWHTKSHNCITLSDASQRLRCLNARGAVVSPFENGQIAAVSGVADEAYRGQAELARRHVVFFKKEQVFLLVDHIRLLPDSVSLLQWNIHAFAPFRTADYFFQLQQRGASLSGHILGRPPGFFSLSSGWDPPMVRNRKDNLAFWKMQHHLRYTVNNLNPEKIFAVLLVPKWRGHPIPKVSRRSEDGTIRLNNWKICLSENPAESLVNISDSKKSAYFIGQNGLINR